MAGQNRPAPASQVDGPGEPQIDPAGSFPAGSRDPDEARDPQEDETSVCLDPAWLGQIASTEGLFVTDERQRVRAWSPAAQKMLGFSADEVVGQMCYEVLMGRHPEGHPVCSTGCPVTRNARKGRGTAPYEVATLAKDGLTRYLVSSVLVLKGTHGSFRVVHMLHESAEMPPSRPPDVARTTSDAPAEPLTRRELEVLRLFARGLGLDEIAAELGISVLTARNHGTTIQHKLGVRNRLSMVLEGMRRGLV